MGKFLNKIVENNVLFVGVLIVLSIILITLIILIVKSIRENRKINVYEENLEDEEFKRVKNVKKEDIIETPDIKKKAEYKSSSDIIKKEHEEVIHENNSDELEQRYYEEKQKEFEEMKKNDTDSELEKIISKMEEDSKLKPEEVVANFEKEQEAQSIISYKELVKAVKNRTDDYEDELESRPLDTVSDLMDEFDSNQYNSEKYEEKNTANDNRKFRNTDVISPVFGIVDNSNRKADKEVINLRNKDNDSSLDIQKTIDLSKTDLSDLDFMDIKHEKSKISDNDSITALDEIYKQMATDLKDDESEDVEVNSKQLNENEEFLQSLKNFRSKL